MGVSYRVTNILNRQQCITLLILLAGRLGRIDPTSKKDIREISALLWIDLKPLLEDIWSRPEKSIPGELFGCIDALINLSKSLEEIAISENKESFIKQIRDSLWKDIDCILGV